MNLKPCRECHHETSNQAISCPNCGAPYPTKENWDGYGFEYQSESQIFGWPLLHISFKYRANRMPVPARGVFAIGQFAYGGVTLSQFGIGLVSVGQFVVGGYALAQFAVGYSLIAQFGVYVDKGYGQIIKQIGEIAGMF